MVQQTNLLLLEEIITVNPEENFILDSNNFDKRLAQTLNLSYNHNFNAALVYVNIDNIVLLNDKNIEGTTEQLRKDIKKRFQQYIFPNWILGQLEPEAFGIIISKVTSKKACEENLLSLHDKLTEIYKICEQDFIVSISIGVAFSEDDKLATSELQQQAKNAIKIINPKSQRKISFYSNHTAQKKINNLKLVSELKTAIRNDEFEIHFQPIISLKQRRVTVIEVLIRWQHPTLGLLLPYEFINLAREENLLTAINELAINKVFAKAKHWLSHNVKIAFNLPADHLLKENFVETMNLLCQQHDIPPNFIELEITEEKALEPSSEIIEIMQKIKHYGYHIVLDDFGVGYSSLQHLSHFPIDKIKIDRSFIAVSSLKKHNIIKSILSLCNKLNICSLCEGVETRQQLAFLSASKCQEIQGFFFSAALPHELVEPYIKNFSIEEFL